MEQQDSVGPSPAPAAATKMTATGERLLPHVALVSLLPLISTVFLTSDALNCFLIFILVSIEPGDQGPNFSEGHRSALGPPPFSTQMLRAVSAPAWVPGGATAALYLARTRSATPGSPGWWTLAWVHLERPKAARGPTDRSLLSLLAVSGEARPREGCCMSRPGLS